jgi:putative membrane protein insertion efficiency factor
MKTALIQIIRFYQRTLSPDHGVMSGVANARHIGCRYYPSCSEYAARAVEKHGVARGLVLGTWRVLRCNPFSAGGVDEI